MHPQSFPIAARYHPDAAHQWCRLQHQAGGIKQSLLWRTVAATKLQTPPEMGTQQQPQAEMLTNTGTIEHSLRIDYLAAE